MSVALDVIDRRIGDTARTISALADRMADATDLDEVLEASAALEALTRQAEVLAQVRTDVALAEAEGFVP